MKKLIIILNIVLYFFLISSCSEEKVINDIGNNKDLLAISFDEYSHFMRVSFPSGKTVSDDLYYEKNSNYLTYSKIENVRLFLKYVIAFVPEEKKITIIDKNTFKIISEISFEEENLEPVDIAFANATEGYVIFKNSPKICLLDVYYFKKAKYIELKGNSSAIASVGNQIYVTIPMQETVSIIDSRYHDVVAEIEVLNVPYLIYPSADGKKFVIISAGMGKIPEDPRDALSVPSAAIIDIASRKILSTHEIKVPGLELLNELPKDFIITNNDWAFIITSNYLIRLDVRDLSYSNKVEQAQYTQLYHNNVYNEPFLLENNENVSKIYRINSVSGKKTDNISINKKLTRITLY